MQKIISKFILHDSYINSIRPSNRYLNTYHYYITFGFGSDVIAVYGRQGEDAALNMYNKYVYTTNFINLYYYKNGVGIEQKVKQKEKSGFTLSRSIAIEKLTDRTSDKIWKMNYLLYIIFSKPYCNEDLIKYINQISVIKFLYCNKEEALLKKHMEYMNKIYEEVK